MNNSNYVDKKFEDDYNYIRNYVLFDDDFIEKCFEFIFLISNGAFSLSELKESEVDVNTLRCFSLWSFFNVFCDSVDCVFVKNFDENIKKIIQEKISSIDSSNACIFDKFYQKLLFNDVIDEFKNRFVSVLSFYGEKFFPKDNVVDIKVIYPYILGLLSFGVPFKFGNGSDDYVKTDKQLVAFFKKLFSENDGSNSKVH